MSDISLIISSNADKVSKDLRGIGDAATSNVSKVVALEKAMKSLEDIKNRANSSLSIQQYGNELSKLQSELDKTTAKIGQTSQAEDEAAAKAAKAASATKQLAAQTELLRNKYQKGYAASKQLTAATRELDTALELGIMTTREHRAAVALLGSQYQKTGKNSVQFAAMQRMAGKSTNKFGMYSQQVGYQVGDFAVQVQSGTNALVAFGQQGTQLAGLLPGLAGAVLGIGLAIGTAVARSVLDAKKLEIDFKAVISELKKPLQTIKPILDAISGAFKSTGGAAVSVLSTMANNLDRVVLYITVAATAFGVKLVAGLIAAKVATFSLAGAFAFLRTAIIRTGIGAAIILVSEAIRMFFLLKKQLGGFGPLLDLLKEAFFEVLDKIANRFSYLSAKAVKAFQTLKVNALLVLSDILSKVNSDFVNKFVGMVAGMISAASVFIKGLPAVFVSVWQSVALATAKGINSFVASVVDGVNKVRTTIGKTPLEVPVAIQTHEDVGFGLKGRLLDKFGGDANSLEGQGAIEEAAQLGRDVREAFDNAVDTDYVGAAQTFLAKSITDTFAAIDTSSGLMSDLNAIYDMQGTALGKLSAAYDALGEASDIDFGKMLTTKTDDDEDGSGSSSEGPIAKLKREIALNTELLHMSKEKAAVLTQVRDIQKQLADDGKTYDAQKLVALVMQNNELKKQRELFLENQTKMENLSQSIADTMGDAFTSIVDGTMSVKDAFRSMARDIIKQLYQVIVVQRIVGSAEKGTGLAGWLVNALPFADGGAFSGGSQIQAYANGGVVNGPTTFPMNGGKTGLMGEAGPEAIMPLKRGSNGKLGVQMEGGGGQNVVINQSFNFQANGDDTVKKLIAQAAPKIAQMTKSSLLDDRRRGGSTKAAFG